MSMPFARVAGRYDDANRRHEIDAAIGRRRRSTRIANLGVFTGYRIGLDLGNGNIGWCIIFENGNVPVFLTAELIAEHNASLPPDAPKTQLPDLGDFVPLGTHKFQARDAGSGISFSKGRANARARRKTLDARQRRRWHVCEVLRRHGLYPKENEAIGGQECVKADVLRVALLTPGAATHPHDLGRAIYNALKRRGWMAPVGRTGKKEDTHFGKRATANYREALATFGCETVGAFLDRCQKDADADGRTIRKRHKPLAWQEVNRKAKPKSDDAQRSWRIFPFLSPTFELMWDEACILRERQAGSVPISDEAWAEIEKAADFRRELRAKEPGHCEYLADQWRCVRALPSFQEFRILHQVANLTLDGEVLSGSPREEAVAHLRSVDRTSVFALGRAMGKVRLGLAEKDASRSLSGARTDVGLAAPTVLGPGWMALDIEARDRWTMLFLRRHRMPLDGSSARSWSANDEATLRREADQAFGEGALDRVDAVAGETLEDGFANISELAARILAKGYRERLSHDERLALLANEGGMRPVEVQLYERLPYYAQAMPDLAVSPNNFAPPERTADEERQFGRTPNPDVHIVLNRLRKVVNTIIDMMGGILPSQVIVEFAREALSEEAADKHSKTVRERTALREAIVQEVKRALEPKPLPVGPSLDRIVDRWIAAARQGWRDYDGNEIPRSDLVDSTLYQLDHVSPAAFGAFQQGNLFVSKSRLNNKKGKNLPWAAFQEHRPALITFARFGKRGQLEGLKAVEKSMRARGARASDVARIQERVASVQKQLDALEASEHGADMPQVLRALERSRSTRLEMVIDPSLPDDGKRGPPKAFRPSEQAALFARLGPDARVVDGGPQARDVANIGWSTKLAARYVSCLGATSLAVKPWAVHALRCMFGINKDRKDLRNHAVDAFLIAHFDERVMRPAFQALDGAHYEELYDRRFLEAALDRISESAGVYQRLVENLARLNEILPTIATAHRADNMWNPGDRPGGSFGALGGENIYAFHPDPDTLRKLSEVVNKARKLKDGPNYRKDQLVELLCKDPGTINDPLERKACQSLRNVTKVRYRQRPDEGTPKNVPSSFEIVKSIKRQPGAFINAEGKFAIAAATAEAPREIIDLAVFSADGADERASLFTSGRTLYRANDTISYENKAWLVTGFENDGRMSLFPVDVAGRERTDGQKRLTVPANPREKPPEKLASDVLGRRLHRRRKSSGDLEPVPYCLFG